jgi:superfamily I DNA and/or RNA helicase
MAAQVRDVREEVCQLLLRTAPVVVSSCVGASQLLAENVSFPMVVLDEGSQATEPALLCALAAAKAEQLVILGDTRQLPPTVASESVELRQALGFSPMARLEKIGVGQRTLAVQYRMPPELLQFPSRYFYESLVTCPKGRASTRPPRGFAWPGGQPLCFIHLGHDLEVGHAEGGKSNPEEAALAARIVTAILDAGEVSPANVAIIAPYARQVDQIREQLVGAVASACRVGTVDSFQGQETDLVLFSATRSNELGDMGFLQDPRRLCVAITRARRGLILVGDVRTLRRSHHWTALIDDCETRGCLINAADLFECPVEEQEETAA